MGPPAARFRNHPVTKVGLAGNRIYSYGFGRRPTQTFDWIRATATESPLRRAKRHIGFDDPGADLGPRARTSYLPRMTKTSVKMRHRRDRLTREGRRGPMVPRLSAAVLPSAERINSVYS
jgi:hypothetical protein